MKSKEAEDRHGYMGFLGDPKKSSSSPELSSPPALHKGIFLTRVLYFVLLLKLLCILVYSCISLSYNEFHCKFLPDSLVPLVKSEGAKRKMSRSRMVPLTGGPQFISKGSKSAPVASDPTDSGPKEPPILVTPSESFRYPLDPCFVFLQLYHASFLGAANEKPQPVPEGEVE